MDLKQKRVDQLATEYGLPTAIVEQCVDSNGIVDTARLGIASATAAATRAGMATANIAQVEALRQELKEAEAQAKQIGIDRQSIAMRMIQLKSAIFRLQGHP